MGLRVDEVRLLNQHQKLHTLTAGQTLYLGHKPGPAGLRGALQGTLAPPPRGANPRETEWTWWAHTRRWKRPCLQTAHIAI
jgi:hypothetical protein